MRFQTLKIGQVFHTNIEGFHIEAVTFQHGSYCMSKHVHMYNNHWHIIIFDIYMLNCVSRITKIKMCYMAIIASYLATYTVNLLKQNQSFYVDLYKMWDAASSLPHTKTLIEHMYTPTAY